MSKTKARGGFCALVCINLGKPRLQADRDRKSGRGRSSMGGSKERAAVAVQNYRLLTNCHDLA